MTDWAEFGLAFLAFAGSHFLPRLGGWREAMIGKVGRRGYFAVYGVVSLLVLIWMIGAAARAPYVEVWPQDPWTRRVPGYVMPVALFFAVIGVGTRSAFTLGSRRSATFDAADPGLAGLTRHPMLWALALWSMAHLPPNGDLAHVLLFGGFAAASLAAMPMFDRRATLSFSPHEAISLFDAAPTLSGRVLLSPAWLNANGWPLFVCVLIAGALLFLALKVHVIFFGASPFA